MAQEFEEKELHLYIDFKDKIPEDTFRKKIFFRIANLHKGQPLVQLNDYLFKGCYENCTGTNLFFEEVEDCPIQSNAFDRATPIHLKPSIVQNKVISLVSVKIPSKSREIPKPKNKIKINNQYDYDTLLKKLADGSLNVEDLLVEVQEEISVKSDEHKLKALATPHNLQESNIANNVEDVNMCADVINNTHIDEEIPSEPEIVDLSESMNKERNCHFKILESGQEKSESNYEHVDILSYKYEKLRELARRPTKRKPLIEQIEECDPKYNHSYNYNSIKSEIIQPSDAFPIISKRYDKQTLQGAVDLQTSVLEGVIAPSDDLPRILTEDEKQSLLSMENLKNLSIPARYWVLKSQLKQVNDLIASFSTKKLAEVDQYGRTLIDTANIYKRLLRVLNGLISENYSYNSEEDTDDEEIEDVYFVENKNGELEEMET